MSFKEKRIAYIDISKGLGMLAVIWGHIMHGDWSNTIVYAFDIPLFFFLAGMVYNSKKYTSIKLFIKNRVKTLLIPYVFFSIITWIVWVLYNVIFNVPVKSLIVPLFQTFIAQGSTGYLEHNVPLWFVSCLFVVEIFYYFIAKLDDCRNIFICLCMAIIGHFMIQSYWFDFTRLPWNIESAMSAILFYSFGNLFVRNLVVVRIVSLIEQRRSMTYFIIIILTGILILLGLFNGPVSLGSNNLGKSTIIYYFSGLCGIISTLFFSKMLVEIKSSFLKKVVDGITKIGRNSFYFMVVHVPIKRVFTAILAKVTHLTKIEVSSMLECAVIIFILTLICSSITVQFIKLLKRIIEEKNIIMST